MTKQEDTRRRNRRDLLLILLILPFGILCMFMTGQVAIKLAPTWLLPSNMFSNLDPNADFAGLGNPLFIAPLNPAILTQPAWDSLFLTPGAIIPTRAVVAEATPVPPRTPQPPPVVNTPIIETSPTATLIGPPIILPTKPIPRFADLAITKTDGSNTYTPGRSISYTIVVKNNGPDPATRFNVNDNIPAVITGLTVNCTPASKCGTNTSSGNTVSFSDAALNVGEQLTITIGGLVVSSATGNLSNTAQVTVPPRSGYSDANLTNNTSTDTDTLRAVSDLAITKTGASNTYTATDPIKYTVVVTNNGPSDAQGVQIVDNKPSQIASWDWGCTTVFNAAGCNGVTGSTSNFTDQGVRIQVGGRLEYTVTAYLPAGASSNPSNIVNTASVLLPGSPSYVDPNPANNSSTVTTSPYIDLGITKTDSGAAYAPNGTIPYTVTVTNNSTFDLTNIVASDLMPTQITNWTWTCPTVNPNPSCSGVTNSNADFTDAIDLAAGASLTYNVTATVSATPGLGGITNTATVDMDPLSSLVDANPANNSASVTTPPYIDLEITKGDGVMTYTPGGNLTYIVTVTNNSGFDLTGVTVTDTMPVLITSWSWTCTPDAGPPTPSCTPGPSNTNINDTAVNLPAGRSVIYTINATVNGFAAGVIENDASVSPPAGVVDVDTSNNTATDLPPDVNALGGPNIGPPDGNITSPVAGTTSTYFFNPAITNDGSNAPDFVFFERDTGAGIAIDIVAIELSIDGTAWTQVFYWGDSNPDLNSNVASAVGPECGGTEYDNCTIPASYLYSSNGYNSGVTIDIDSLGLSGSYPWIRFICPTAGNLDGICDIDAIQPWYP